MQSFHLFDPSAFFLLASDGHIKAITKPVAKSTVAQVDMALIKQANEALDSGKPSTALSLFRRGSVGVDIETKPKLKAKMEACQAKLAKAVATKAGKKKVALVIREVSELTRCAVLWCGACCSGQLFRQPSPYPGSVQRD